MVSSLIMILVSLLKFHCLELEKLQYQLLLLLHSTILLSYVFVL